MPILYGRVGGIEYENTVHPMPKLCVNIDHVATVRQARRIAYPCPVEAALLAEEGGSAGITCHLREDRRHIQDADVFRLNDVVKTRLNLEMAVTDEMMGIAEKVRPYMVMFVPEKREEVTTEGGLDVAGNFERVRAATERMKNAGLRVSHFIDPIKEQVDAVKACSADVLELHTGAYADAVTDELRAEELSRLETAGAHAHSIGLLLNAGHGLNLRNILPVAALPNVNELHIGHSIVGHAVMVGFERATREMVDAIYRGAELGRAFSPQTILKQYSA